MERMILHSDINACYASIELLRHPELRGRPVAVGGEQELRHGIILAKDQMARAAGVRTGMTLWAARQQCPELTILPPDFDLYYDYSRRVRQVYADFTDRCEPFGMDECWLDMTGCVGQEDALQTAQAVRQRVLDATGLTVSVGVSWCKVIAKLGSDYRKPNAVTVIDRARFADMVWPLPLRSIGVRALDLQPACAPHQMDLFEDAERRARARRLDITLDNLRARYGKTCVLRGRACFDPALGLVQREEHAFLRK